MAEQHGDGAELAPLAGAIAHRPEELRGAPKADDSSTEAGFAAARDPQRRRQTRPEDLVGQRLGPYRILRPIGEGGMGAVFLAERDDAYRQRVAVKLLRALLPSSRTVERFRRERQALADLDHPAIARLLDGGETPEGWPYLVLELIEGERIDQWCESRQLSTRDRLRLVLEVCGAVEHAHHKLVVHRDLKPGNILVTAEGRVKLLDFGIAKLLAEPETAIALTQSYERILTPEYAAPEQVRGGAVTTATDVYALGVLLYRLLTGAPPYTLPSGSFAELERVICETPPRQPRAALQVRTRADERRARDLESDLEQVLLMALRKEPDRRYPTVGELAADLRRWLGDHPVVARPDTLRYRSGKFLRRHRAGVAATLVAALALVGGTGMALWQARQAGRERDAARAAAARAERLSDFLRSTITLADPSRGAGRQLTVAEMLDGAAARLDREPAADQDVASLRLTLGETYRNLGLAREAEQELRKALRAGPAGSEEARLRTARSRAVLALALNDQGHWQAAAREARTGLVLLGETGPPDEPLPERAARGLLQAALTAVEVHLGHNDQAIAAGRAALTLLRSAPAADPVLLATVLNNLAIAYGDLGRLAEAEPLHREALATIRATHGDHHPQTVAVLANLAAVVEMQGRPGEAEPLYRAALEVQERALGEGHPDFIRTLTSFANLLHLMHRPEEAARTAGRALGLARAHLGDDDPLIAYAGSILSLALLDLGQPGEAEAAAREALARRERLLPPGHWLIGSSRANLGAALLAQGRVDEARRELRAAHELLLAARGPDHEKTRFAAELLRRVEEASGRRGG